MNFAVSVLFVPKEWRSLIACCSNTSAVYSVKRTSCPWDSHRKCWWQDLKNQIGEQVFVLEGWGEHCVFPHKILVQSSQPLWVVIVVSWFSAEIKSQERSEFSETCSAKYSLTCAVFSILMIMVNLTTYFWLRISPWPGHGTSATPVLCSTVVGVFPVE